MNIVIAIIVFGVIIVIHELGHFIAARRCGVLVEEFAIGMGPKLFGIKRGDTLYSLRLLPIGGSCRMLGEESPQADEDGEFNTVDSARSFLSKSVGKRLIIITAGIVMNVLLAFVVVFVYYSAQEIYDTTVDSVVAGYPAEQSGLKPGDRILRINGKSVNLVADVQMIMSEANGTPMTVTISRNGKRMELTITPRYVEEALRYYIGFSYVNKNGMFATADPELERAGFVETVRLSYNTCVYYVKHTFEGIWSLFTRKSGLEDLSGPIGIVNYIGDSYEQSMQESDPWAAFWDMMSLVAALSINLAVFNLLPVPALDGGRMIFLLVEGVRGKPISPEKEGMIHFAGFVMLMILAVFVAYSDILKLI